MPDILDATGLTVKTLAEITSDLKTGFRAIYGADINVDQNSPDGQMIGILAQAAIDIRELAVQVNNGFDPDQAQGAILDQRVAINNVARAGGTYTIQPIDITVNATVDLQGLDAAFNDPSGTGYTVQDDSGNQFILIDSDTLTAGPHTLSFRSKTIGLVNPVINTITNPVTIVLGVTLINNGSAPLSIGTQEETDAQLRVRREASVALAASGYLNGLLGTALAITGVTDGVLYENVTDITDGDGIPAHGIWLVVDGGANSDIADAIYAKKSYGANMKGDVTVDILTASGAIFTAKFDRPVAQDLYIRFNLKRLIPAFSFDTASIKAYMVANLVYKIGQFAETSAPTAVAVAAINSFGAGSGLPLDLEISDDGMSYTDFLDTGTKDKKWTLDVSRITISVV